MNRKTTNKDIAKQNTELKLKRIKWVNIPTNQVEDTIRPPRILRSLCAYDMLKNVSDATHFAYYETYSDMYARKKNQISVSCIQWNWIEAESALRLTVCYVDNRIVIALRSSAFNPRSLSRSDNFQVLRKQNALYALIVLCNVDCKCYLHGWSLYKHLSHHYRSNQLLVSITRSIVCLLFLLCHV